MRVPVPIAAEADADLDLDLREQVLAVPLGLAGQSGQPPGRRPSRGFRGRPEEGLLHGLGGQRQLHEVANEHAGSLDPRWRGG